MAGGTIKCCHEANCRIRSTQKEGLTEAAVSCDCLSNDWTFFRVVRRWFETVPVHSPCMLVTLLDECASYGGSRFHYRLAQVKPVGISTGAFEEACARATELKDPMQNELVAKQTLVIGRTGAIESLQPTISEAAFIKPVQQNKWAFPTRRCAVQLWRGHWTS